MEQRTFPKGIVALKFTRNECYTEVVEAIPDGLMLDLDKRVWFSWRGWATPIGMSDVPPRAHYRSNLIIGVYDVTDIQQLRELVHAAASIAADLERGAISD